MVSGTFAHLQEHWSRIQQKIWYRYIPHTVNTNNTVITNNTENTNSIHLIQMIIIIQIIQNYRYTTGNKGNTDDMNILHIK